MTFHFQRGGTDRGWRDATWRPWHRASFAGQLPRRRLRLVPAAVIAILLASAAPPASASYYYSLYQNDNGFDTCAAKTQAMLTAWWNGTPWYEIGMYLGGSVGQSLGCYDGSAAVDRALNTGYGTTLYWYGPQLGPPCNMRSFAHYISLNTTTAYNQGVSEANAANSAAVAAGLPTGTRIFYDMEAYYANSGCRAAAASFINGWDYQLGANTAFWGAAYGSSCASYVSDWATIGNVPNAVSPSDTNPNDPEGGLDNGSVYGYPCLSDGLWIYDQRVGQFSYDTRDAYGGLLTYNGVTLSAIDENCADSYLPSIFGTQSRSCSDVV